MTRAFVAGILVVLGAAPLPALARGAEQRITIDVRADGARAQTQPHYDPSQPLDVRVTTAVAAQDVSIVAGGPAGERLEEPLARSADGGFTGALTLADPGGWTLRVNTRTAQTHVTTAPIAIEVELPPPSDAWLIGLGAGSAVFVVIGGGGFVALRRLTRTPDAAR